MNPNGSLIGNQSNQELLRKRKASISEELALIDTQLQLLEKQAIAMVSAGETTGNEQRDSIIGAVGYSTLDVPDFFLKIGNRLCAPFPGMHTPWTREKY